METLLGFYDLTKAAFAGSASGLVDGTRDLFAEWAKAQRTLIVEKSETLASAHAEESDLNKSERRQRRARLTLALWATNIMYACLVAFFGGLILCIPAAVVVLFVFGGTAAVGTFFGLIGVAFIALMIGVLVEGAVPKHLLA